MDPRQVSTYYINRPLSEIEHDIACTHEHLKEIELLRKKLERLEAERRAALHLQYFQKYGEWDWIVRQQYMDLVRSLAHVYPFPDNTRGYSFELHNYTPQFPLLLMDEEHRMRNPKLMVPYDRHFLRFGTLTEFVKPENIAQCKLTPRIVEAFQLLKYLAPDDMKGRGFGMSRQEESWAGSSQTSGPGFDYEGWKFHLVKEPSEQFIPSATSALFFSSVGKE